MKLLKMKCNNCSAQLNIDLDNLQAYCPYCGQKLMMDFDQLALVLAEKEKTKRAVEQEKQITDRTKMAYEHESNKAKASSDKVIALACLAFILIALVFSFVASIILTKC